MRGARFGVLVLWRHYIVVFLWVGFGCDEVWVAESQAAVSVEAVDFRLEAEESEGRVRPSRSECLMPNTSSLLPSSNKKCRAL